MEKEKKKKETFKRTTDKKQAKEQYCQGSEQSNVRILKSTFKLFTEAVPPRI